MPGVVLPNLNGPNLKAFVEGSGKICESRQAGGRAFLPFSSDLARQNGSKTGHSREGQSGAL